MFDIFASFFGLLGLSPIIALKIRKSLGSSVSFKQVRTGKDGKPFQMVSQHWYRDQVCAISGLIQPELATDLNKYFFRIVNFYSMRRRTRDALALLVHVCTWGLLSG